MAKALGISPTSVTRGFKELGLYAYRLSTQSKLTKKHVKVRYEKAKLFRKYSIKFYERFLISDEKIWTVDGYFNPQNERVRAQKKEDVPAREKNKFCAKRMVWLGMSARALTPLVYFKGSVNGKVYLDKVLKKVVLEDVMVIIHDWVCAPPPPPSHFAHDPPFTCEGGVVRKM